VLDHVADGVGGQQLGFTFGGGVHVQHVSNFQNILNAL
jgi:hypothetical protein